MRAVALIAGNFLREQRWLTLLLAVYAFGGAALFGHGVKAVPAADVLFFLHQQALYAVLFSVFLAASAIHNERKSRRILAVLSKAITRGQYLAGLLAGIVGVSGIYCLAIGLGGTWLMKHSAGSTVQLWLALGLTAAAALLSACVTLLFTTFMNPLFATAATAVVVGMPLGLEKVLGPGWGNVLPVYTLASMVSRTSLARINVVWEPVVIALAEAIVLWLLAGWIFARRDITVAVE